MNIKRVSPRNPYPTSDKISQLSENNTSNKQVLSRFHFPAPRHTQLRLWRDDSTSHHIRFRRQPVAAKTPCKERHFNRNMFVPNKLGNRIQHLTVICSNHIVHTTDRIATVVKVPITSVRNRDRQNNIRQQQPTLPNQVILPTPQPPTPLSSLAPSSNPDTNISPTRQFL